MIPSVWAQRKAIAIWKRPELKREIMDELLTEVIAKLLDEVRDEVENAATKR